MLRSLKEMLRPPRIDSAERFRDFVSGESALIAQKTATSYCRVKTLLFGHALFTEQDFIDALARCRWEAFAAVLADALLIAESLLRPHAPDPGRLAADIAALYPRLLAEHPLPAHRPEGWGDVVAAFRERVAEVAAEPPADPVSLSQHSAHRLYAVLPIHTNHRSTDEELIEASVTFQMVALRAKMQRAFDAPALAACRHAPEAPAPVG